MRRTLDELFHAGESPYLAMYVAGLSGYELEDVEDRCRVCGISLRGKDYRNYENGRRRHGGVSRLDPITAGSTSTVIERVRFDQLTPLPEGWHGTRRRWFPCNREGKPMMKWGWSDGQTPRLMDYEEARRSSPCGWVGQNMLYQPFVVIDVDGVGHGMRDDKAIAFGHLFKDRTCSFEAEAKRGSFHLWFTTDRLVPIMHFPWAHIDLMGNANNGAVYLKDKEWNHVNPLPLDEKVWNQLRDYVMYRKEGRR